MDYDVVIIGAGMSGLASGIRLAYFDKKVLIVEKHFRIGGLNSYYEKGGYELDVGLHALTNYADKKDRSKPLIRLLRQLRIGYDELHLSPQKRSKIKFNDKSLYFSNDFELLRSEVADKFSGEIDGFNKLYEHITGFNELDVDDSKPISAREVICSYISDPLLTDMILCPLMFYGNSKEDDMDFWQFVVMFKSIFLEGLSRPYEGVRIILDTLNKKYEECGGELSLNTGVKKIVPEHGGGIMLELTNGETVRAKNVLSSAGYFETMALLDEKERESDNAPGRLSFIETVFALNKSPADLGIDDTITFYSTKERFEYRQPKTLIDEKSGVICCPNNFMYDKPLDYNMIRVTNISNSELWDRADKAAYKEQKKKSIELMLGEIKNVVNDFKDNIIFTDIFTPKTIEKFTGHIDGTVYGAKDKIRSGRTHLDDLYICGTDQGFLGITGAMLSGITITNLYLLK